LKKNTTVITLETVLNSYEKAYLDRGAMTHSESFEHDKSYQSVIEYLSKKGGARQNFRHYAPRKRIESIIDNSVFYLTDGSNWNDRYDRAHFNPPYSPYKNFGICLSATSEESIAMWMLYGGTDGNGSMINFDKRTLQAAMSENNYECGSFKTDEFSVDMTLDASQIRFSLMDVLYFSNNGARILIERANENKLFHINEEAFRGIEQITKHRSWSYEKEVRLVASVNKQSLGNKASKITAIRAPLKFTQKFVEERVFDSPVSDGHGKYLDSELQGTVDWNLCSDCNKVTKN
jgi:hypothetical protein